MSAERFTVLVVDDEPYILSMLRDSLAAEYDVLTASSVLEAERLLSTFSVDILLTDQKMPVRSGIQLLEWVRNHSPRTIRLLMTGYSELEEAIDAINRGNVYYYLLKPWRTEDLFNIFRNAAEKCLLQKHRDQLIQDLQEAKKQLEKRVAERTHELQEANLLLEQRARELERLALTDPLTGLYNRRAIEDLAAFELKRHARYPSALTLGYIDVDFFKQINTRYLLTGGDEVLKSLAHILTNSLREVDSIGRVGGEEFLIIARETGWDGAVVLAERIRSQVESTPIDVGTEQASITVSIGFAVAEPGVHADFPSMTRLAASALAEAKQTGRNRCIIHCLQKTKSTVEASAS